MGALKVLSAAAGVVPARRGSYSGRHMLRGVIHTLAGTNPHNPARLFADYNCDSGFKQAGPPLKPCRVAFDQAGNAVLTTPDTVRVIPVRSGRFYGQAMTAGDV